MIQEQYGTTQVREIKFSPEDLLKLVLENLQERDRLPYDFDYNKPIVLWDNGNLILRFIQSTITKDGDSKLVYLKKFDDLKR